jgi:hypothetical protein
MFHSHYDENPIAEMLYSCLVSTVYYIIWVEHDRRQANALERKMILNS